MRLLLYIVDYPTGVCVFKKTWKWARGAPCITEGVANLVVSFHQLANSLGTTPPTQVIFEEDSLLTSKSDKKKRAKTSLQKRQRTVGCVFSTSKGDFGESHFMIGSLFYHGKDSTVQAAECIEEILGVFVEKYKKKIQKMTHTFEEIIDEKVECEMTMEDVLAKFSKFEDVLETLSKVKAFDTYSSSLRTRSSRTLKAEFEAANKLKEKETKSTEKEETKLQSEDRSNKQKKKKGKEKIQSTKGKGKSTDTKGKKPTKKTKDKT